MKWTDEHRELRRTVARFVEAEVNPYVDEWENAGRFPAHELFGKLGELGLLGITKPEEYGGMGLDFSYSLVMAEELGAAHCGAVPMAIGVQTDMATPALARFGSDELKKEFLAPTVAGEKVVALGVSEPHAGSDVANIKTTAAKDGDDYLINGTKMWMTNGLQADWVCLLAKTGGDDGKTNRHNDKSLIVVPADLPGISRSEPLNKLGMRASDTAQMFFDNVRVPQRYRIGEEGLGFMYQMLQFQEERLWGAASALKGLENIVSETIDYTRERTAFGKPILDNQVVHFRLAELQTEIEALRALVYSACEVHIGGGDATRLASMCKLKAGRLSREVADSCLQYWGGQGYMWESRIARAFRDQRLMSIGGGADEVMLAIICKHMGILAK
jgi:citronellyl-CoA dehydrogenase